MLRGIGGGELSENLCPGVGHLSILLDAANVVLFSIFHLKKYVYLNNFKEVKRYMWFSLHHFPIPQYFLHPFASRHRHQFAYGGKTINASFEELKEKMLSLCVNG